MLKASRKIKVIFSGDLSKPIVNNPWFNGKESDLLRCQIARIRQNITIIPNVNNHKVVPDSRDIEPNEDAPLVNINDCLNIRNWVHFLPGILKEGRTVHEEKEAPEGVEPEDFKKQILANDPFDPRLKSISDDGPVKCPIPNIIIPAWKLSYTYDDKIYTNPHIIQNPDDEVKKDNSVNNTIVFLRSLIWPGAYVVRIKNQVQYYYFGWGNKYNDDVLEDKFVFTSFPKIQTEVPDLPTGDEPNGEIINEDISDPDKISGNVGGD
jgi:radial spoke head protein 4A